ncbi:MAG TPA: YbhN family protein, partial [Gaiellaceae bacterium]|nr:YbhN family protein [Gaiellaceae bacterium]
LGTMRALFRRPVQHLPGLLGVAFYWFGDIACLWAALRVFSVHVSWPALVVAYETGYVASRRSLPAGGAGIVEVLMTFALVWVGLPLAPALAGVLVYRLFNFWLPIVPALALLPSITRLRHAHEQAESA